MLNRRGAAYATRTAVSNAAGFEPQPSSAPSTIAPAAACMRRSGSGSACASIDHGQYASAIRASAPSHTVPVANIQDGDLCHLLRVVQRHQVRSVATQVTFVDCGQGIALVPAALKRMAPDGVVDIVTTAAALLAVQRTPPKESQRQMSDTLPPPGQLRQQTHADLQVGHGDRAVENDLDPSRRSRLSKAA